MKINEIVKKINCSEEFQKFKKENSDAYPCSFFFNIDKEKLINDFSLDYYAPSLKELFTFQLPPDGKIIRKDSDILDKKWIPEQISVKDNFDFQEIERLISDEMKKQNISNKIQKILLSLQRINGRDYFEGVVFVSGLGMIKINIDLSEMKFVVFEKKGFFDVFNILKKKK